MSSDEFQKLMALLKTMSKDVAFIKTQVTQIKQEAEMAAQDFEAALANLQDQVQRDGEVVSSAVTLLNGIAAQLDAAVAANDPAALLALSESLRANTDVLANAVAANTPVVPPTP